MIVNETNVQGLFSSLSTAFNKGFAGAPTAYRQVAMTVPSSTRETTYGWMGALPGIREWIGDRHINSLAAHGHTIVNKDFESTISVSRNDIEDDQFGVFGPMVQDFGREAAEQPDKLVFNLLKMGFETKCYDGQYFFDLDHPMADAAGNEVVVSNTQGGSGRAWFLLDTSRAMRPFVYQERRPFDFVAMTDPHQYNVFIRNEFIYGVSGRCNAGYGLWQLAYGSRQPLTPDNYANARAAMQAIRGENGRLLGIRPTTLVIPTSLEQAGRKLINAQLGTAGESNEWFQSAELIITPWLEA